MTDNITAALPKLILEGDTVVPASSVVNWQALTIIAGVMIAFGLALIILSFIRRRQQCLKG